MGSVQAGERLRNEEMDAWLRDGGQVVAASERAARALTAAYHRARRAEGATAWPAPCILDWQQFVRDAWQQLTLDGRLLLTPLQEQALWTDILAANGQRATLLPGPRQRMAALAMQAHQLLCSYAPKYLDPAARAGWPQDTAVMSGWLTAFDEACRSANLLSPGRLPLELLAALQTESASRPPLLLAGFDRILPVQRAAFDAWGEWHEAQAGPTAAHMRFHAAADEPAELAACALWCRRQLEAHPEARLLVVTQEMATRRGQIERAFLRFAGGADAATPHFEFSLGVPLSQTTAARSALLVLRWLEREIEEHEVDWLISSGQTAADEQESQTLAAFQRALRRRQRERTRWRLADFLTQRPGMELPAAWALRMKQARQRLDEIVRRQQSPLAWAEFVPQLLEAAGWPGKRPLASAEYQALQRWQRVVEECASLGFDGRRIDWRDFYAALERAAEETLFAPESHDAPILITGPTESAGLTADAIWFLGAHEDAWPAGGATQPLLPLAVQREAAMPHATAQLDWELATAVTQRLAASAAEIHFSYARQNADVEARPSRLIVQLAGAPTPVPAELAAPALPVPLAVPFADAGTVPFPAGAAPGGASVLTAQSQCPFKAFAATRLDARPWEPAQAGLTAAQRGQLLHAVLHAIWGGPPDGLRSHKELLQLTSRRAFVEQHVHRIVQNQMPAGVREWMPRRYLELEEMRLIDLLTEWLDFEAARLPFTVAATEADAGATIAGLSLQLRLDRIDELNDQTLLVIDYKTGDVSPKAWEMPRPDDVQLPLYASYGLPPGSELGGLVFARVRAGERSFAGRVADAKSTLLADLSASSNLARKRLSAEELMDWRAYIETMARNFVTGRADVDPRAYPETCKRCGLQALCRIQEAQTFTGEDGEADEEAENG